MICQIHRIMTPIGSFGNTPSQNRNPYLLVLLCSISRGTLLLVCQGNTRI